MKINGVEKLIPNLFDKKRYVIHIRALNQALKHGLVLEKIHRAIEFQQLAWMKEYIDFNIKLRTAAKNDFEKDFYKLMNNLAFGKTMENIRKHKNIKLITNREAYLKAVRKPNFKSGVLFGENLCTYQLFPGRCGGRADPRGIDFFKKILSNSRPLGKHFLSNSPP